MGTFSTSKKEKTLTIMPNQPRWGDEIDSDDDENFGSNEPIETPVDANGIKTVTSFVVNDDDQRVKITKKVQVKKVTVTVPKSVIARRNIPKFGSCKGLPPGIEDGITSIDDEIFVKLKKQQAQSVSAQKKDEVFTLNIVCRKCGKSGDHWTSQCPYKDRLDLPPAERDAPGAGGSAAPSDRYVPPGAKDGARGGSSSSGRDDSNTVRVTNLSEDTREDDLKELLRPFGPISRLYLAKNRATQVSRGFAFVTYVRRSDGQKAIDKLNGFGYD